MNKEIILEKFFNDIGLDEISPEEKEKLFENIFKNLENRILVRLRSIMSDEEVSEWEKLDSDEELDNFYKEKGIDIDSIAQEEARLSREQLIQNISYIKGKME
jgi:hypothetical protein